MFEFEAHCNQLAALETFDPGVFEGDEDVSQSVCNFVLALALVYNDFKDATLAHVLLEKARPQTDRNRSREWGCFYGIDLHIVRVKIALVRELLQLIRDNKRLLTDKTLQAVVKQLRRDAREAWHELVRVAQEVKPSNLVGRMLLFIRNKLSFHYDPKVIAQGYSTHFLGESKIDTRAFISRGATMSQSRFYFADAAAEGYLQKMHEEGDLAELMEDLNGLFNTLNRALMGVVEGFVQKRSGGYRSHNPEVA